MKTGFGFHAYALRLKAATTNVKFVVTPWHLVVAGISDA
jgi:hypothetical protein